MNEDFLQDGMDPDESVEVGLTPLIDVVFQLLVFFMLTSSFTAPALQLLLPQLEAEDAGRVPEALLVEIEPAGGLYLNGQRLEREEIKAFVEGERQAEQSVEAAAIRADGKAPYERVLEVMQALSEAGIQQIHFVYEPEEQR